MLKFIVRFMLPTRIFNQLTDAIFDKEIQFGANMSKFSKDNLNNKLYHLKLFKSLIRKGIRYKILGETL